jgi:hypothetical protein
MHRPQTFLAALFLGIAFAPHSGATVYQSDGSDANVQAIHDTYAHDGDTITLPAGTFIWTAGVSLTKGITVSGETTITGAGTATCTADDQTIIIDEKLRSAPGSLFKATIPAGKSFRLTGITFEKGVATGGNDGAIQLGSAGMGNVLSARVDHCHFYHLTWGATLQILGWTYGVDDHNLFEALSSLTHSHFITNGGTNGVSNGNGAWADFPYYGSEKFWFIEDNTIMGGFATTAGGIDCLSGGRYVARHNYWWDAIPNGHGTEGWAVRGMRALQIYNNVFHWTYNPSPGSQRSGSSIWHDNTFEGPNHQTGTHTSLTYYRELGAAGGKLGRFSWGRADGANEWDLNDTHGVYFSGTAASNTTIVGSATFTTGTTMTPSAYQGMQVRNDHVGSACYLHSAFVINNTVTRITYYYYGSGDRGAPLVFNLGDEFSIRKVIVGLDQNGRGKGDLVHPNNPRFWPNQQQETCFSWNNRNSGSGQVLGYGNDGIPTEHEGTDYVNLGAGLPANQIPAQVTAAYPTSVNGGSAYDHEFTYPHPLVTGGSDIQPNGHGHSYGNSYGNSYGYAHTDANAQAECHAHTDFHSYAHADSDSHCDTDANVYSW